MSKDKNSAVGEKRAEQQQLLPNILIMNIPY